MTGIRIGKGVDCIYTSQYMTDIGIFRGCSSLVSVVLPFVGSTSVPTFDNVFGYVFGKSIYDSIAEAGMVKVNQNGHIHYIPATLRDVTILGNGSYAVPGYAMENLNMISSI